MSTAAAAIKSEYFKAPNDFVEHMYLLTDAEVRLALMVLRRNGISISDSVWENWSGRSARHKLNALHGLRAKNVIKLHGRGHSARFEFDAPGWSHYWSSCGRPTEKPRTFGRGPTIKTPIARAHPDCIAGGCQMARRQESLSPLNLVELRKPVSDSADIKIDVVDQAKSVADDSGRRLEQNLHQYDAVSADVSGSNQAEQKQVKPLPSTKFRKPVSNSGQTQGKPRKRKPITPPKTIAESNRDWPLATAQLVVFGQTALSFLVVLIPLLLSEFPDLTDSELADAMKQGAKPGMKGPGLWKYTVPDYLRQGRADGAPEKAARAAPSPPPLKTLETVLVALWCDYREKGGDSPMSEAIHELMPYNGAIVYDAEFHKRVRSIDGAVYARLKQEGLVPDLYLD